MSPGVDPASAKVGRTANVGSHTLYGLATQEAC
jgi:hypothetical protein